MCMFSSQAKEVTAAHASGNKWAGKFPEVSLCGWVGLGAPQSSQGRSDLRFRDFSPPPWSLSCSGLSAPPPRPPRGLPRAFLAQPSPRLSDLAYRAPERGAGG